MQICKLVYFSMTREIGSCCTVSFLSWSTSLQHLTAGTSAALEWNELCLDSH